MEAPLTSRAVLLPKAYLGREPGTVHVKTIVSAASDREEFFESTLTPDEAETLAFEIWEKARLARYLAR